MSTLASEQGRKLPLLMLAAVAVIVIATAHSFYISLFGADIPFWDQWSQLHEELVPWWQGAPSLQFLFTAHNEHRIFFTRLISMALIAMNQGHWSNLVEAYVNSLICAGALASLFVLSAREIQSVPMQLLLLACVIGMGCLPYDWENTLVGFQNQFYFMLGSAAILMAVAAYATDTNTRLLWMLTLGIASLFTMASGLMAPLAAAVLLLTRGLPTLTWSLRTRVTIGGLLVTSIGGLFLIPHLPGDIPLQAKGIQEHARGLLVVLMWPLEKHKGARPLFALILWLPTILCLVRALRRNSVTRGELFLLGMAGWGLLQAFAIAHARGHGMTAIPSRYTTIVAAGVMANLAMMMLWAVSDSASKSLRRTSITWLIVMLPLILWIMWHRTPSDVAGMRQRGMYSQIETANLSGFVSSGDRRFLMRPGLEIPYPNSSNLEQYLADPALRRMVINSIQSSDRTTDLPNERAPMTTLVHDLRKAEIAALHWLGNNSSPERFQLVSNASPIATTSDAGGRCTVDALNGSKSSGAVALQSNSVFTMQGWVIWPKDIAAGRDVLVLLGNSNFQIALHTSTDRRDVVKVMQSDPSLTQGFSVSSYLGSIPTGTYTMAIARASASGQRVYCKLPTSVTVSP